MKLKDILSMEQIIAKLRKAEILQLYKRLTEEIKARQQRQAVA